MGKEIKIRNRKSIFIVTARKWDQVANSFIDTVLWQSDNYQKAERWAQDYDGDEEFIRVQRWWHKKEKNSENTDMKAIK